MDNIKISIITPCFNSEKTIKNTLESVLNQTYDNYEYIIVDGKSTDKTLEIINEYKDKFGAKLTVISEKDKGIYDAMNKGIRNATGDLIGIVNSDDYYEKDTLEKVVKTYDGEKYVIIYGLLRTIKNGQEYSIYSRNHKFLAENMITHPTCFISKKIYEDFGLYSMEYRYSADYEFMLRIKDKKSIKFKEINEILSNYSIDGASSSKKAYLETLKLRKKYNLISKKRYYFLALKTKLSILLKK